MVFSSLVFIFAFLPVVWAVFHLLKNAKFSGHYTAAKVFLICASFFFYAYFKLEYLPILLGTIIVNFTLARLILRDLSQKSNPNLNQEFSGNSNQNLNPNLSGELKQNSNQEFNGDFSKDSRATSLSLSLSRSSTALKENSKQNSSQNSQNAASVRHSERSEESTTKGQSVNSKMDSSPATQAQNDEKRAFTPKFYFILGIIFNLCLLGFFKYTDFLLENFNAFAKLANLDFEIPLPHILLPIALSFVTFQQIAFLFDCYKRAKGEISENLSINFIDYALFISFFPQLIAGPIVHHREMMPQFTKLDSHLGSHSADFANFKGSQATQPSSPSKFAKSHESTAATARIAGFDSRGESKNSQNSVNFLPNLSQNSQISPKNSRQNFS